MATYLTLLGQARNKIAGVTYLPQRRADEQTGIEYPDFQNPTPGQLASMNRFAELSRLYGQLLPILAITIPSGLDPTTQAAAFIELNQAAVINMPDNSARTEPLSVQLAKASFDFHITMDGVADWPQKAQFEYETQPIAANSGFWPMYIVSIKYSPFATIVDISLTIYSRNGFTTAYPVGTDPSQVYVYFVVQDPSSGRFSKTKVYNLGDLIY